MYNCIMANISAIYMAASCTYHLPSPSCSKRAIQKSQTLNEKYLRVFWRKKKKGQENGPLAKKMTRQKEQEESRQKKKKWKKNEKWKKRGDRKGESNDSPEIPDRRVTWSIPGHSSGVTLWDANFVTEMFICALLTNTLWSVQRLVSFLDFIYGRQFEFTEAKVIKLVAEHYEHELWK